MSDHRSPRLKAFLEFLEAPSIGPSIARKIKKQTAQARAAFAEEQRVAAPPRRSAKDPARSAATKRGHAKRPKSVAMAEIEKEHFPKWYRNNVRDGDLPRGIRDGFAQEMVELFSRRGVKISAGSVRNHIPMWIRSIEGA
jgi:hypothetical protein